ncbi:MAG: methyltransferase domain-containing protein [Clostridiaceae bacterium]|nr:methyltransferase domain-containing protein [Clostridiaceae bacterium]
MDRPNESCIIKNSLYQSHEITARVVKAGDHAIDATCGNGGDTLFLAGLTGEGGKVYSFDIQREALDRTSDRLKKEGLYGRVELIHDTHERMDEYVKEKVRCVMFNLGYLPGGDHSIGTRGESTIAAVKKAMELLMVNGIITIVVYYGGDSGFSEKEEILDFIRTINYKQYTVTKTEFVNQINCPPILVCIEKLF